MTALVVAALVLAAPAPALFIESHVKSRPPQVAAAVPSLLRGMNEVVLLARSKLSDAIAASVSQESGSGNEELLEWYDQRYKKGYESYLQGRFEEAIDQLQPLVVDLLASAALVSTHQVASHILLRSLAVLSHAQVRAAREAPSKASQKTLEQTAKATMGELIRTFPSADLREFGNEVVDFHRYVSRELSRGERFTLRITPNHPAAALFVNERYVGTGVYELRDAIPGRYRVMAQLHQRRGRVHGVTLPGTRELPVDLGFDLALRTQPSIGFVGFEFGSEADRDRLETSYAIELGRLLGAETVFIARSEGPRIRLSALSVATGKVGRVALVDVGGEEPVRTRALEAAARYVAGGAEAGGLFTAVRASHRAESRESPEPGPSRMGLWKWITLGTGVAVAAVGAYFVAIDGAGTCDRPVCPSLRDTQTLGLVGVGVGAALLATSATLFYYDGRAHRVAVSGGPGFAWVSATVGF